MNDAELVVVGTFLNKIDAEMAHSALQAADIESLVSADDAGGLRPTLWMSGVTAAGPLRGCRTCPRNSRPVKVTPMVSAPSSRTRPGAIRWA